MKLGSDAVGVVMGLFTIPMALLSIAGVAAGLVLALGLDWSPLIFGLAAFLACSVLAQVLERLVIAIDEAAAVALGQGRRGRARIIAVVSGALPVAVVFAAEIVCLRGVFLYTASASAIAWLWGYIVATGPWTLYAGRVSRFRRTLVGIRAYYGHVALWLFSIVALWLDVSPVVVVVVLLAPAFVPFTVGLLLALSDREAIANVRV